MKTFRLIVIVQAFVFTYGLPMPDERSRTRDMVTGVFIPADTFNNLKDHTDSTNSPQNQLRTNLGNKLPNGQNPSTVYESTNRPSYYQQPDNYQQDSQQPSSQQPNGQPNQQQILYVQPTQNPQPNGNNQPILFVQQPSSQQSNGQPNQPIVLIQQPSQNQKPNQPIYLVQQPVQNQQQLLGQPNQQPIYLQQPNQQPLYVTQSNGQPTQVVIGSSNGNQVIVKPVQNQPGSQDGVLYTLVPLNGQNSNTNGGWTLVPVQSGSSNPIVLSNGK